MWCYDCILTDSATITNDDVIILLCWLTHHLEADNCMGNRLSKLWPISAVQSWRCRPRDFSNELTLQTAGAKSIFHNVMPLYWGSCFIGIGMCIESSLWWRLSRVSDVHTHMQTHIHKYNIYIYEWLKMGVPNCYIYEKFQTVLTFIQWILYNFKLFKHDLELIKR